MKIRNPPQEELEFQIAPMCDVLLVLLVFFVSITSASVLRSDPGIVLPVAANSNKKETAKDEAVLNVRWDAPTKTGFVSLEQKKFTNLEDITLLLTPRFKNNNNYRVVIRGDVATPSSFIQKVMAASAEAGVSDIIFTVINRGNIH